jgi:hypothetical protein
MVAIDSIKKAILNSKVTVIHSSKDGMDYAFWITDEIDDLNLKYNIHEYLPGYLGIGTDYCGDLLAVELETGIIYSIPFIPMDANEKIEISVSIEHLLKANI